MRGIRQIAAPQEVCGPTAHLSSPPTGRPEAHTTRQGDQGYTGRLEALHDSTNGNRSPDLSGTRRPRCDGGGVGGLDHRRALRREGRVCRAQELRAALRRPRCSVRALQPRRRKDLQARRSGRGQRACRSQGQSDGNDRRRRDQDRVDHRGRGGVAAVRIPAWAAAFLLLLACVSETPETATTSTSAVPTTAPATETDTTTSETVTCTVAVHRLCPVDEAQRDPSFHAFREALKDAANRKDEARLLELVDPAIRTSFGGNGGHDDFRSHWKTSSPDSELWPELTQILTLGGTFGDASFWA